MPHQHRECPSELEHLYYNTATLHYTTLHCPALLLRLLSHQAPQHLLPEA